MIKGYKYFISTVHKVLEGESAVDAFLARADTEDVAAAEGIIIRGLLINLLRVKCL